MKKAIIVQMVAEMPDELDADELIYRIYLRKKLERAEFALASGDFVPHEEVVAESDEWLK